MLGRTFNLFLLPHEHLAAALIIMCAVREFSLECHARRVEDVVSLVHACRGEDEKVAGAARRGVGREAALAE